MTTSAGATAPRDGGGIEPAGEAPTTPARSITVVVPGARLHVEVRGSGPMLLLIPGGPQDAGLFGPLARSLADRYTVVAYDARGTSRTTTDGPLGALDFDVQADDAAALVTELGGGAAFVFGTSGGAQIGLHLAARHSGAVRALVAHEPPAVRLLADPTALLAANREIHATFHREGVEAAMAKFLAAAGLEERATPERADPGREPSDEAAAALRRMAGNLAYWLEHALLPLSTFVPDLPALRGRRSTIAVAIGEASVGQPIHAMATAVADALGIEPSPFPGDHTGFVPHAGAFAEALHRTLDGR